MLTVSTTCVKKVFEEIFPASYFFANPYLLAAAWRICQWTFFKRNNSRAECLCIFPISMWEISLSLAASCAVCAELKRNTKTKPSLRRLVLRFTTLEKKMHIEKKVESREMKEGNWTRSDRYIIDVRGKLWHKNSLFIFLLLHSRNYVR